MSDKDKAGGLSSRFGNFSQIGASLRQSAQELGAKAAASVNEINTKMAQPHQDQQQAPADEVPPTSVLQSDQVSKEELLDILQKMNRKVKALSLIRQQLTEKVAAVESEKHNLQTLVVEEILNGTVILDEHQDSVVPQLQRAWRVIDEQNALNLQSLQMEFQKLAHGSGNNNNNADWTVEKQQLVEQHAHELATLRQELVSASSSAPSLTTTTSSSNDTAVEVQRVKDAAAAQLQAIKKKFAAARLSELDKVKTELAAAAQAQLEMKLHEQSQAFEVRMTELQNEAGQTLETLQTQWHTESANRLQAMQQQHALELQQVRQGATTLRESVETYRQAAEQNVTTEMEEKLQEVVGEMRRKHQEELERLVSESAQKVQQATVEIGAAKQSAETAQAQVAALQQQLETVRTQYEQNLQATRQQLENAGKTNAVLGDKDDEIVRLRTEISTLASAKDTVQREMERKLSEAEHTLRSTTLSHEQSVAALKEQMISQLKEREGQFQQLLSTRLGQAKTDADAAVEKAIEGTKVEASKEFDKLREDAKTRIQSLEEKLRRSDVAVNQSQQVEQALKSSLEELQLKLNAAANEKAAVLAAARDGEQSSHQMMEGTLSKQRESYDQMIESLKQRHAENMEKSRHELVQVTEARDLSNAELQKLNLQLHAASTARAESERKYAAEFADHQKRFEEVQAQLTAKQEELGALKASMANAGSVSDAEITQIRQELEELNIQKNAQVEALRQEAELARKSYESRLKDTLSKAESYEKEIVDLKAHNASALARLSNESSEKIRELEGKVLTAANSQSGTAEAVKALDDKVRELSKALGESELQVLKLSNDNGSLEQRLTASQDSASSIKAELEAKLASVQVELDRALQHQSEAASNGEWEAKFVALKEEHLMVLASACKEKESELERMQAEHAEELRKANTIASSKNAEHANELDELSKKHHSEKEEMRKTMEAHIDKMKLQFVAKLDGQTQQAAKELEAAQQAGKEKDEKLEKLIERLKALTSGTTTLRNENEEMKLKLDSESRMQQAVRAELDKVKKEMEETVANSSATASSLLQQQEALEKEKTAMQELLSKMKSERDVAKNKYEEVSGKLEALSANLSTLLDDKKVQDDRLQLAAKNEAKLTASEAEVADLREQINKLKLELTQNASLVTRLQSEKDAAERSQGQRTALVGMLETQLAEMNDKHADANAKLEAALYDLSQKDETIAAVQEQSRKLEGELSDAKAAAHRAAEALATAQKGAEAKTTKTIESLQRELQASKQQMARKSAAAQKLLQDREAECSELRKANQKLLQEVNEGSVSDRRIFELAAKQSNRESQQVSQIEIRDNTIERFKIALLERDSQLAIAEKRVDDFERQVEELVRVRRREDVNLDYLKSIVVQYLSLPPGSSERARLLPVLATLLQFNAHDYRTIEEGKKKVSWWGSVSPTPINPPVSNTSQLAPPNGPRSPSSSNRIAEVSVSRDSAVQQSTTQGRATSLQF